MFMKKQVLADAFPWSPERPLPPSGKVEDGVLIFTEPDGVEKRAKEGDWIVSEMDGPLYVVPKGEFEDNWTPVPARLVAVRQGEKVVRVSQAVGISASPEGAIIILDNDHAAILPPNVIEKFVQNLVMAAAKSAEMGGSPLIVPASQMPNIPPPGSKG